MATHFSLPLTACLLVSLLASCGGSGTKIDPSQDHSTSGFSLNVLNDSFVDGASAAGFDLSYTENGSDILVSVNVENASGLKALYFSLDYDAERFTPLSASPATAAGAVDDMLNLSVFSDRGTAWYGQVLGNYPVKAGMSGDGTLAQLKFSRSPAPAGRIVSTPPTSLGSTTNLVWDNATDTLDWYYYNQGDCDQNGEVNISDLTPIGAKLQQRSPLLPGQFPEPSALGMVDCDDNGEINISDITPIGVNFHRSALGGYNLYTSESPAEYPEGGTLVSNTAFADSTGEPTVDRRAFTDADNLGGTYLWVRVCDGATDGRASNIVATDPALLAAFSLTNPPVEGDGSSVSPYIVNDAVDYIFTVIDPVDGNVSTDASTVYKVSGTGVATMGAGNNTLNINDGVSGDFNVSASYKSINTAPAALYFQIEPAVADTIAPTVISTVPDDLAIDVPTNIRPTATFSEPMDPLTIDDSSLTLRQGLTELAGEVFYQNNTASFHLEALLAPDTEYTATITTAATDLAGNPLAEDYVWTFTTSFDADLIAPTVFATIPDDLAIDVPTNIRPKASFSEQMDPLSINDSTFTLMNGLDAAAGEVFFEDNIASFHLDVVLEENTEYTATITTGATDVAGNPLAEDYVWTFTTGVFDDQAPTVMETSPLDGKGGVSVDTELTATFSEEMDLLTVDDSSFTLQQGLVALTGVVSYDNMIATFIPDLALMDDTEYTATITVDATDLAGNPLEMDYVWTFTTAIVNLGGMAPFGGFGGGAGMTNQGIFTVVEGDIGTTGASTLMTGFHDANGDIFTETPLNVGEVTGIIYTAPPAPGTGEKFAIASQAAIDAQIAFDKLSPAALPGGIDAGAGELGGLTLGPGIYKAAGGTFQITGNDLTLDAQGDENAIWVFQMASSLTVGDTAPRSIILINGAQARNVFWYVGSAATINGAGGGTMIGTIMAYSGVTFSTAGQVVLTRLIGRAIGLNASVTLVNTIITLPPE